MVSNNGSAEFVVNANGSFAVTPEFIGARLLLKMRKMAERRLGLPIKMAVMSVPAEFDERQRNYTVRAAQLAGQRAPSLIALLVISSSSPLRPPDVALMLLFFTPSSSTQAWRSCA